MVQKLSQSVFGLLIVLLLAGCVIASPYFAIGADQWQDALDEQLITSIDPNDYNDISWIVHDPNESYPYNVIFRTPDLYVYSPAGQISISADPAVRLDYNGDGSISFPDFAQFALEWLQPSYDYSFLGGKGLVMAWGNLTEDPCTMLLSGWQYTCPNDPNYANVTITVTVCPYNADGVTFGLEDVNKKRMIWRWDVGAPPKPLPYDQPTLITINTALDGVNAATPTATSFSCDPGFDITKVKKVLADEWGQYLRAKRAPAPGRGTVRLWNDWQDLTVVPNPLVTPIYFKWRQPAQFVKSQSYYWGWDEVSIETTEPSRQLLADDWCCTDNQPITGIRWWGSFQNRDHNMPGWQMTVPPAGPGLAPVAFHIGIWSDTPGDPNGQDLTAYSHPNEVLFSQYCYQYDVNFVGFDRDPNKPNYPLTLKDSCFKFSCNLDPNFIQDPNTNRIYWLSIAAVYTPYSEPNYVWGWKTRPHYYNDDAVRIYSIVGGGWPPIQGSQYQSGQPLYCPKYCSWDLAFELITDQNNPDSCNCFRR